MSEAAVKEAAPERAEWVDPRAKAVEAWYQRVSKAADGGGRASMARLRRCPTPEAAALEPESFDLALALKNGRGPVGDVDLLRAGFVAGILGHVRGDLPGRTFGATLAASRKAAEEGAEPQGKAKGNPSGKPRLSEQRFVKLCDARGEQEAFVGFRRALAIVDDKAPVASLAVTLLDWFNANPDPRDTTGRRTRADAVRIRFAKEYYEAL